MTRPGPPPKPTAQLRLAGSWRAKGRAKEPVLPVGAPDCPDWLDDEGKQAWHHFAGLLLRMRVLTASDAHGLAMLCEAWSRYRNATRKIRELGDAYVQRNARGVVVSVKRNPYVSIQNEQEFIVRRWLAEFGLTPAARTRTMAGDGEAPQQPKSRFFSA